MDQKQIDQLEGAIPIEAGLKAERQVEKQLDVSAKDVDAAVQETAKELK